MTETSMVCRDHRCSHHVETNADGWADDVRLSDIEPNFTCTRCGKKGAEVRPAARALAKWTRPSSDDVEGQSELVHLRLEKERA